MDQLIDRLSRLLLLEYIAVWALAIITYILGETDIIPGGILAAPGSQTEFAVNMANIILMIIVVPLSLKLFTLNTQRNLRRMNKEEALDAYHLWSAIRLGLLLLSILAGITSYFLLLNTTGLLCACISLVTTLLCIPSKAKIINYLNNLN